MVAYGKGIVVKFMRCLPQIVVVMIVTLTNSYADVLITKSGDEFTGKIVNVDSSTIQFLQAGSSSGIPETHKRASVFMIKYDDGRKVVLKEENTFETKTSATDNHLYTAGVVCETGLFGLVNINEETFDPGVFTLGVTPSIERRINHFLSVGGEYMILWAKAKKADETRFLMNCNALARLTFPLTTSFSFLAQMTGGLSIWPEGKGTYPGDDTFFKDRIGWNLHGGLGFEYITCSRGSIIFCAAYNANFSTLEKIPVTIDMLMLSVGPRVRF